MWDPFLRPLDSSNENPLPSPLPPPILPPPQFAAALEASSGALQSPTAGPSSERSGQGSGNAPPTKREMNAYAAAWDADVASASKMEHIGPELAEMVPLYPLPVSCGTVRVDDECSIMQLIRYGPQTLEQSFFPQLHSIK